MDTSKEKQNVSPEDLPWRRRDTARGPRENQSVVSEDSPWRNENSASALQEERCVSPVDLPWRRRDTTRGLEENHCVLPVDLPWRRRDATRGLEENHSVLPVDLPWRRTGTPRGRPNTNTRGETNFPSKEERLPFYCCTREQEDMGYLESTGKWMISCDYTIRDQNGFTELDRTWRVAKELWNEGIFYKVICFAPGNSGRTGRLHLKTRDVRCFMQNCEDIERIILSASELRRRCLNMPYPFYFKSDFQVQCDRYYSPLNYLCCVDGDLYKKILETRLGKFKLIKSSIC